jgi:hypothetical protein
MAAKRSAKAKAPAADDPVLFGNRMPALLSPIATLDSLAAVTKAYAKAFAAADLDDHFEALARPALWLIPKRVDERKLALGNTKLGGHPDLPAKAKWPRAKGEPLTRRRRGVGAVHRGQQARGRRVRQGLAAHRRLRGRRGSAGMPAAVAAQPTGSQPQPQSSPK